MRLALVLLALVACTFPEEPRPVQAPRGGVSLESVRVPPDTGTRQISGTVAMSGDGAVTLDSGGPTPIPLWFDASTKVIVDGQPGTGAQLREGDLVRAAYRFDSSGEMQALQVVVNSRPVPTSVVTQPPPRPALQMKPR